MISICVWQDKSGLCLVKNKDCNVKIRNYYEEFWYNCDVMIFDNKITPQPYLLKSSLPKNLNFKFYSSHGNWTSLRNIVSLEKERNNSTFDDIDSRVIKQWEDKKALWITPDPLCAYRYKLPAEEYHISDEELLCRYPTLLYEIEHIEITDDMVVITEDYQNGLLVIKKKIIRSDKHVN